MKNVLLSVVSLFILFFNETHAKSVVEVYAHSNYITHTNITFDDLASHLDAQTVSIVGLNGDFPLESTYPSFDNLLLLPNLENLFLCSGSSNTYSYRPFVENSRNPQISEEQWNVIKSCPIKKLTLFLGCLDNIPLYELKDNQTLKHLTVHLPESRMSPPSFLEEQFIQLNELSGVSLSLSGVFPNIDSLNVLDSVESLDLNILTPTINGFRVIYLPFGTEVIEQLKYVKFPKLKKLKINSEGLKGLRVDLLAPEIEHLDLTDSDITGSTVNYLKSLTSLQEVYLGQSSYEYPYVHGSLTSGVVCNLSKILSLRKINLAGNRIKGADFSVFESLKYLESLDLSGTDITRADLLTLHGLKQLKELKIACLRSSTIREEDIQELSKALSHCKIIREK